MTTPTTCSLPLFQPVTQRAPEQAAAGDASNDSLPSIQASAAKEQAHVMSMTMGFEGQKVRQRAIELASNGALGTSTTALHELRSRYFLHELPVIEAIEDKAVRTQERRKMTMRAIGEYVNKASSPVANVSAPHQAMNNWAADQRNQNRLHFLRKLPFRDVRLSLFAQHVVQMYEDAEELCPAHTAHDAFVLLYLSSRSALMYERDTLRNNVLLCGEHGAAKGYALTELCKKVLIEGTYISVTSQSADMLTDDLVAVHEELPQCLFSRHSNDGEMEEALNGMQTRGASSRLVCFMSAPGKRQTQLSESEKNVVVFGACSIKQEDVNPTIASRMLCTQLPRNRHAQMQAARNGKRASTTEMQHDYYLRQVIHNDVEKLIMIGALEQPHLECFAPIYMHYESVLKREYNISVERRQTDQIRMMLRSVVIAQAIEWLYNSPVGPCYGRAYSPRQLPLLEPMLHDTEELVYFALDLCRHTLINPNHEALIEFLRTNWVPFKMLHDVPTLCAAYLRYAQGGGAAKRTPHPISAPVANVLANGATEEAAALQTRLERFFTHKATNATEADSALTTGGTLGASNATTADNRARKRTDVVDWNYVSLGFQLRPLAEELAELMEVTNFRCAMSASTIESALGELRTHGTLTARQFVTVGAGDEWPPVEPQASAGLVRSEQIRTGGDGVLMLHSSLAFFERGSPHEAAIAQCMNQYTPVGYFVAGRPVSAQAAHLVHVRRAVQTQRRPEVFIGKQLVALDMSYNDYATECRLEYLGVPLTAAACNVYDPVVSDAYARTLPGAVAAKPITYPDDLIRADVLVVQHNLDVSALNAAGVRRDAHGNVLAGIQRKRRAPTGTANEHPIAKFQAAAYTDRRVYDDGDVNRVGQTSMYDGRKLREIDLAVYDNNPLIVRVPKSAEPMNAGDFTTNNAEPWKEPAPDPTPMRVPLDEDSPLPWAHGIDGDEAHCAVTLSNMAALDEDDQGDHGENDKKGIDEALPVAGATRGTSTEPR